MWILITGYWDDTGVWDDTDVWYDGPYGTLAANENSDTAAFSGTVAPPAITGILAATESPDTALFVGLGVVTVSGAWVSIEATDIAHFTGIGPPPPSRAPWAEQGRADYGWYEREPQLYRATEKLPDYDWG